MAIEIEYKFLIKDKEAMFKAIKEVTPQYISQFYLNTDPERTVRVRIKDDKAYITIKGMTKGISRAEYEYEIPQKDALEMKLLSQFAVTKERYVIPAGNQLFWEIDVFKEKNNGLIIAEIELPSEDTFFNKPDWLGKDVTTEKAYANSNLALDPYLNWL